MPGTMLSGSASAPVTPNRRGQAGAATSNASEMSLQVDERLRAALQEMDDILKGKGGL